jgi:ClpP class serine protease
VPRETTLTPDLLARVRHGQCVAVSVGAPTGILPKRSSGYRIASARAEVAGGRGASSAAQLGTVAVVEIRGVMEQYEASWSCGETCGYDGIERDICNALKDPGVAALVVLGETPGGDEPGLVETTDRIREVADGIGKPILGYTPSMLASAGVYLLLGICDAGARVGSKARMVYAHPTARVGSVSSVVPFASESRRLKEEGIDVYMARGLPGKMNPNSAEPLDALGKARLDEHARACSEEFVLFVAAKCGLDPEIVRSWNADLFRGQRAVDVGLVAGLATLDSVIALAGELAGLQEAA